MAELNDLLALKAKRVVVVETQRGFLQVLEYFLQDCTYLHVVQWHFNLDLTKDMLPAQNCKVFYDSKTSALKFAAEIGQDLLDYDVAP